MIFFWQKSPIFFLWPFMFYVNVKKGQQWHKTAYWIKWPKQNHRCLWQNWRILLSENRKMVHSVPRIVALIAVHVNSVRVWKYVHAKGGCILTSVFTWLEPYVCALIFLISTSEEPSQPIANQLHMQIKLSDLFFWIWRPWSLTHTVSMCFEVYFIKHCASSEKRSAKQHLAKNCTSISSTSICQIWGLKFAKSVCC